MLRHLNVARDRIVLGDADGLLAAFNLVDPLREEASQTVFELRALGLVPMIASGDHAGVVAAAADRLGGMAACGDLRAADKLKWVRQLQRDGHVVAMVGDGVNDAPVLAGADISLAMGSGTDLAKVSADIVMLGETLTPLMGGIETARRTLRIVRQNLSWRFFTTLPQCRLRWPVCWNPGWRRLGCPSVHCWWC